MRVRSLVLVIALIAMLAAPVRSADPVTINVILPLSGSGGAARPGRAHRAASRGETRQRHRRHRRPPGADHIVAADDQSNPQVAVQIANQLIAKNAPVILGSSLVALCAAIVPLLKNGPVLYCMSPGIRPPPDYAFTAGIASGDLMAAQIHYLHDRNLKRLAWIGTTDASGQDGEAGLDAAVALPENAGMSVIDREHFTIGDLGVDAQMPMPDLKTPADVPIDYLRDLGLPGEYPFTRGVQPTMYRGSLWTMRMFAGFGTPEETNARFKYLLAAGADGPLDRLRFPDAHGLRLATPARRSARSGMCGVAVDTLRDMEVLFDGIPLDQVTTSMTINGPAIVLLAFYVALADERGIPRERIGGTVQNDMPQGVHRAARVARPAAPGDAHRHRHDRVLHARGAALEHGHRSAATTSARPERPPRRSSRSRWPTGIAYVAELRRARARRRRLRAPALVLLRRAQRLLRGDRQVPRRAPDVGRAS